MSRENVLRDLEGLVPLAKETAQAIYQSVHIKNAMCDVTEDMDLYQIGKLSEVLEATYEQGKRAGHLDVTESLEKVVNDFSHPNAHKTGNGKKHLGRVIEGEASSAKH